MFSIGEFARLGTVSVRALRHYDEIGLLRPAKVDPGTGYRGYSAEQLGQLNRIVALPAIGVVVIAEPAPAFGRDGGFTARHPGLTTSTGTIRLRPGDAAGISDEEFRALVRSALTPG